MCAHVCVSVCACVFVFVCVCDSKFASARERENKRGIDDRCCQLFNRKCVCERERERERKRLERKMKICNFFSFCCRMKMVVDKTQPFAHFGLILTLL